MRWDLTLTPTWSPTSFSRCTALSLHRGAYFLPVGPQAFANPLTVLASL